jgi:hypothetical protein
MGKTVTLQLSEKEFNQMLLCFMLGDFVRGNVEDKNMSRAAEEAQMNLYMKLFKSAYDAGLKGSGKFEDAYFYGKDIEDKMLDLFEDFKEYVESGELAAQDEVLRQYIAEMEEEEKKQKKKRK